MLFFRSLVPAWMIIESGFSLIISSNFSTIFLLVVPGNFFYQSIILTTVLINVVDHGVSNNSHFFLFMVSFIWLFIFIIQCFFYKCYVLIVVSVPLLQCALPICVIIFLSDTLWYSFYQLLAFPVPLYALLINHWLKFGAWYHRFDCSLALECGADCHSLFLSFVFRQRLVFLI